MHNNYYFLSQLSLELKNKIIGFSVIEIFSQSKDELIIGLQKSTSTFYIKGHLQSNFCCLSFPEDFKRSKRNSVDLFAKALNKKIVNIRQFKNERCFSIELENEVHILFKMHGNRSNIILIEKKKVIALFKNNLKNDNHINIDELDREIDQNYEAFINCSYDYTSIFPTFGKVIKQELLKHNYSTLQPKEKWQIIESIVTELKEKKIYVEQCKGNLQLTLLKSENAIFESTSPIDAINHFFQQAIRTDQLFKEKGQATLFYEKKIRQTENYITKASTKLSEITESTNYEILANIIMANLHTIPSHSKMVTLNNFYNNSDVNIKLNEKLSPAKNAENYYRKSKNQKIEIKKLEETIENKENKLIIYKGHLLAINEIDNVHSLRKYLKENFIDFSDTKENKIVLPYHDLKYEGYSIWIGKNAKNNDILTQKLAHKNDLWLHAKDVSGSHVVIKNKSENTTPQFVIEKAAQWAAFYSKRKTDSLCPVIYTPKKYVRKPKGFPPGAVVVDKEQVILVVPEKPQF